VILLIYNYDITLQEVPDHISLVFSVAGCLNNCDGCSWESSSLKMKRPLDMVEYANILLKHNRFVSCVCFLGGEWDSNLTKMLSVAKECGLSTCLYTGKELTNIDHNIIKVLDYIKVGCWNKKLGGLREKTTNQRFLDIKSGKDITYKFQKDIDLKND